MKKIFVSFDFEGLAGVTSWSDVDKKSPDFKRTYAVNQLKALLEGLGNVEVFLVDSHASGDNIPWEITDEFPNVSLVTGGVRKYYMMYGIDATFDAVIFFGYHGAVGTLESNMDHTYSSSSIHNIWINGIHMNEALINAGYAGIFNVPVAMLVGDDKVVAQTKVYLPDAVYVETKRSIGRHSAVMKPRKVLLEEIKSAAERVKSSVREDFKVFKFQSPVELVVEFSDTLRADLVSSMPLVERIDGRKVRLVHEDYAVVFEALLAMTYICAAAKYLV
ncbi:peptidase M55 [Fervidobacterium thailandense]|uniref:Peptidase M55 n=2 Tax=Fervidobacterium thailandense TaxID=1008305 RepID=A0A1E3G0Y2_9BACT|nr:peptidase M55 [Fervidobacterium thailandense]